MSYTVLQADPRESREAILALWQRNLPPASSARYHWLYEAGPATSALLESKDGQVIGAAGLMRRTFSLFGRRVEAAQAVDLNVDRQHRTIGPAVALQREITARVQSGELGFVYGLPNARSDPVLKRAGYQVVGCLARWIKPLRFRVLARRCRWSKWLAGAGAVLDPLLQASSGELFYRRPAGACIQYLDQFDARFDRLWQAAARQFGVIGQRTSDYLGWRFTRCPKAGHRAVCLADANGELAAYVVYTVRDANAYLSDFLFADLGSFGVLLAELSGFLRREGMETVSLVYMGSQRVCRALRRSGFWQRPSDWKLMIYARTDQADVDSDRLLDGENWHLTRADCDTDD